MSKDTTPKRPPRKPGPREQRVKIEGNWEDAMRDALKKKLPKADQPTSGGKKPKKRG